MLNEFGELAFTHNSQLEKDYEILSSENLKLRAELLYCKTHMNEKYADGWRTLLPHVKNFWIKQVRKENESSR